MLVVSVVLGMSLRQANCKFGCRHGSARAGWTRTDPLHDQILLAKMMKGRAAKQCKMKMKQGSCVAMLLKLVVVQPPNSWTRSPAYRSVDLAYQASFEDCSRTLHCRSIDFFANAVMIVVSQLCPRPCSLCSRTAAGKLVFCHGSSCHDQSEKK